MELYFYGVCGLVSIFWLHSTTATPILRDQPLKSQHRFKKDVNQPVVPIVNWQIVDQNNNDIKKLTLQDIIAITTSDLSSIISIKPKPIRSAKHNGKRRDVVLKALSHILEYNTRKTHECHKNDKVKDVKSISASDVVKVALAKPKLKNMAKPEKVNTGTNEIDDASELVRALANIKSKRSVNPNVENTGINEITNANTRSNSFANPEEENTKTDEINAKRSKRDVKTKKAKTKIDAINNGRDIVLEVVKQLIQNEKTRQRFDMVNPPNTKYSKRQQLLWDRLRLKAASELLLHPKPLPQKPTERMFHNFKMDLELETPEPTLEPGLFNDFKRKSEKEFYMDAYMKERLRTREYISTLKPRAYESY